MDGYKRQISYLDYMENGEKTGNAGFVKAEENNGKTRIEVRVKISLRQSAVKSRFWRKAAASLGASA